MIQWITSFIESLGYVGIAVLMFAETLFPPLPSELIMPFAGFSAAMGKLSIAWVIVSGAIGSLAGATLLYAIAKLLREEHIAHFFEKRGKQIGFSQKDFHKAQGWFDRNSYVAVFLCRLVPGIRSVVSIPAGIRRMSLVTFLFLSALGTGIWTLILGLGGYYLGEEYHYIETNIGYISKVVYALIFFGFVWLVVRRLRVVTATKE